LHFLVNDVGMVFFFGLAAKEVFEATLPGGPLASPRRALSPLAALLAGWPHRR
jgi:NhaA family Na+:H+ antiporter